MDINFKKANLIGWVNIICLSFLLFTLSGCKKEYPHYTIREELKPYGVFNKGSYWIYQNDITGEKDSAYCKTDSKFHTAGGKEYSRYWDGIYVFISSDFIDRYYLGYICTGDYNEWGIGYTDKLEIYFRDPLGSIYNIITVFPSLPPGIVTEYPCSRLDYVFYYEVLDQYSLNGSDYEQVIHSTYRSLDTTATNPNFKRMDFYLVAGIGLIKFKEADSTRHLNRSWSLLRYYVVPD